MQQISVMQKVSEIASAVEAEASEEPPDAAGKRDGGEGDS